MARIDFDVEIRCEVCNDVLIGDISQDVKNNWLAVIEPCEFCFEKALDEAFEQGQMELQDATNDSYNEGYEDGRQEGFDDGYAEGLAEAEDVA